jgi:hypothetical protein
MGASKHSPGSVQAKYKRFVYLWSEYNLGYGYNNQDLNVRREPQEYRIHFFYTGFGIYRLELSAGLIKDDRSY